MIPAVSVAAFEGGELLAAAWGTEPDALFQAASISKPVAAFAVLRLVAKGHLSLDADVNSVLRRWRLKASGSWTPSVTLRHLLSHSGAVTVHGFPGYEYGKKVPTLLQILDGTPPANNEPIRVIGMPGLMNTYSGGGYTVLQLVLEDTTQMSFADLIRELVIEPIGMTDSSFEQPLSSSRRKRAVRGYVGGRQIIGGWHNYPELAAAGMWCTASDLVRFAGAVQDSLHRRPGALLPAKLAELMTQPVLPGTALGFGIYGVGRERQFGHTGGNAGYSSELAAMVNLPKSAAVLVNANDSYFVHHILAVIRRILEWPTPNPGEPTLGNDQFVAELQTLVGRRLRVARRGQELEIEVHGQPPLRLFLESDRKATTDDPPVSATLEYDLEGRLGAIALRQQATEVIAVRAPDNPYI